MSEIVVTGFATTPVKGMRIHEVDSIELSRSGARGDRAFYVIDDRGRMVNGKVVRNLQVVVPDYDPESDELGLTFPDGTRVGGRVKLGEPVQTQFFGRPRSSPEVIGPWAQAISEFFDRPLRLVSTRTAVDRGIKATASVVSRGSLRRLAEQAESDTVDGRRFRMLIEIDGIAPHEEDTWVGRRVQIGPASLVMHGHIGRCLITSRDPETAEVDLPTLELLGAYRREIDGTEPLPFGIYGEVLEGGTVRIGDPITVQTPVPVSAVTGPRVRVAVDDHVAVVTLARPEKHNALDLAMFEQIAAAAERVASEPGVRAVVLHGDGPSFCSGLDVASIMAAGGGVSGLTDQVQGEPPNLFQRVAYDWIRVPVPVIAALHGNCLGGGLQIALGADIRIAAPDTRLSVMEVKWGLIPDMSITRTLPRLVSIDVAKELTYSGRIFSGDEALSLGVVTRVAVDPLAAAQELATEIASRSPDAVQRAKRLYDTSWTSAADDSLALEAALQLQLIGSPNQMAAVASGFNQQPAEFADPEPAGLAPLDRGERTTG